MLTFGRGVSVATMLAVLVCAAPVFASPGPPSGAPVTCPAGVPTQTLTIVDQAHVRAAALALVTRAISAQSIQLRAAWGTPCATFGPGGWRVYLKIGRQVHGDHFWYGEPYAVTWTGGGTVEGWSRDLSHEILEMLVDPTTNRAAYHDGVGQAVEVADPVEWHGYRLRGVFVSDFVLPSWFAGATTGEPTCVATSCSFPGPELASADAVGPYDEMDLLTEPWQGLDSP
jgi:hypothetical protein